MTKKRDKVELIIGEETKALKVYKDTSITPELEKIQAELEKLKAIQTTSYKTNGELDGFAKNLQEETDIATLIKANSSVMGREKAFRESAADLGITKYPTFKIGNGTRDAWKHDIKLRIAIINTESRRKKLEELVKEAKSFMTLEDKRKIFNQQVAAVANDFEFDIATDDQV